MTIEALESMILDEIGENIDRPAWPVLRNFLISTTTIVLVSFSLYWIGVAPTEPQRAWWKWAITLLFCLGFFGVIVGRFCNRIGTALARNLSLMESRRASELERKQPGAFAGIQSQEEHARSLDSARQGSDLWFFVWILQVLLGNFHYGLVYYRVKTRPTLQPQELRVAARIVEFLEIDQAKSLTALKQAVGEHEGAFEKALETLEEYELVGESPEGDLLLNPEKPYLVYTTEEWLEIQASK